jgi:hypothetical protein
MRSALRLNGVLSRPCIYALIRLELTARKGDNENDWISRKEVKHGCLIAKILVGALGRL